MKNSSDPDFVRPIVSLSAAYDKKPEFVLKVFEAFLLLVDKTNSFC